MRAKENCKGVGSIRKNTKNRPTLRPYIASVGELAHYFCLWTWETFGTSHHCYTIEEYVPFWKDPGFHFLLQCLTVVNATIYQLEGQFQKLIPVPCSFARQCRTPIPLKSTGNVKSQTTALHCAKTESANYFILTYFIIQKFIACVHGKQDPEYNVHVSLNIQ